MPDTDFNLHSLAPAVKFEVRFKRLLRPNSQETSLATAVARDVLEISLFPVYLSGSTPGKDRIGSEFNPLTIRATKRIQKSKKEKKSCPAGGSNSEPLGQPFGQPSCALTIRPFGKFA